MNDSIMEVINTKLNLTCGKQRPTLLKHIVAISRNNNTNITKIHNKVLCDLIMLTLNNSKYSPVLKEMVRTVSESPFEYNKELLKLADIDWFISASKEEVLELIENLILSEWV